jgi:hypothetical protein
MKPLRFKDILIKLNKKNVFPFQGSENVNTSDWPSLAEVIQPSTSTSLKATSKSNSKTNSNSNSKNDSENSSVDGDEVAAANDQSKENKNCNVENR